MPLSLKIMYEIPEAEAGFRKVIFLTTATTSWVVPSDWNNQANMIEVIGGGGGAGDGTNGNPGVGSGGGYARRTNINLTRGTVMNSGTEFSVGAVGNGGSGAGNGTKGGQYMV